MGKVLLVQTEFLVKRNEGEREKEKEICPAWYSL